MERRTLRSHPARARSLLSRSVRSHSWEGVERGRHSACEHRCLTGGALARASRCDTECYTERRGAALRDARPRGPAARARGADRARLDATLGREGAGAQRGAGRARQGPRQRQGAPRRGLAAQRYALRVPLPRARALTPPLGIAPRRRSRTMSTLPCACRRRPMTASCSCCRCRPRCGARQISRGRRGSVRARSARGPPRGGASRRGRRRIYRKHWACPSDSALSAPSAGVRALQGTARVA